MNKSDYRKALKVASDDLEALFRQREALERKIARLRETVVSLGLLVDNAGTYSSRYMAPSLTHACQYVLVASSTPLDPIDIRRRVERNGFDIRSSNPLASVHSVLNRLVERQVIRRVYRQNSNGTYERIHHYWWGDADLPEGWVAPTKEQFDADVKKTFAEVGAMQHAEYEKTTQRLAKRAAGTRRKLRGKK